MATTDVEPRAQNDPRQYVESGFLRRMGFYLWQAIRLPLLAFLLIVEPVARFVLAAVAIVGILVSFVLEFSGAAPRFPFWLMFGMSVGCGVLVIVLNAIIRRLAR